MSDMKKCIVCVSDIDRSAKICTACGKYQSVWRNEIVYLGSIIGVLTIAVSAFVFIVSQARALSGAKIEVIKFASDEVLVAINNGAASGVITTIHYSALVEGVREFHEQLPLFVELNPGEVKNIDLKETQDAASNGANDVRSLFLCEYDDSIRQLIHPIVYIRNDPEFEALQAFMPNLLEVGCKFDVGSFGSRRETQRSLPCNAVLVARISTTDENFGTIQSSIEDVCSQKET